MVVLFVAASPVEQAIAEETESLLASGAPAFGAAEGVLETETVSAAQLEEIRNDLVEIRTSAEALVDAGNVEARGLQAQIEVLGPAPQEGESEPADVVARRAELEAALSKANAPVRDAREAIARADQLIGEIDARLRTLRQAELLKRYPSAVNPASWIALANDFGDFGERLIRQEESIFSHPETFVRLRTQIPEVVVFVGAGLIVLFWVYPVVRRRLANAARTAPSGRRRWLPLIAENLSGLVFPALSTGAILIVIPMLDITPSGLRTAASIIPIVAVFVIGTRWLAYTLFAPGYSDLRLLPVADAEANRAFRITAWLGIFLSIQSVVYALTVDHVFSEGGISALWTPPLLVSAWLLWSMAGTLVSGANSASMAIKDVADRPLGRGFLFAIARLLQVTAIVVAIAAISGFVVAARDLFVASAVTIGLLGLALALYNALVHVSRVALGHDSPDDAEVLSLVPIGIVVVLALLFAPLLAMTWGATADDLAEYWRIISRGVQVGEIRISFGVLATFAIIVVIGVVLTRWLQRTLRSTVLPRTRLDSGVRSSLITGTGYVGIILSVLIAASTAGLDLSSLAVVLGALSVGIGFGLQAVTSNFVSGLILLIERPIKVGDWIEVSGEAGLVRKISVRSTRIETFDRHDVIVPNSDLISSVVKNMTLSSRTGRLTLPVGVAYGSDLGKTRHILLEAAKAHEGVAAFPEPTVLFRGLGDSSLDFELRCYLKDIETTLSTQSDLRLAVYTALGREQIEIPFPQRDIHLRDIDRLLAAIEGRKQKDERDRSSGN